jgi:hypothetical protein
MIFLQLQRAKAISGFAAAVVACFGAEHLGD